MAGNATKVNITAGLFKAFAFEQLTISTVAVSLTASEYTVDSSGEKAKRAIITVELGQIRYTYDGTTPTASVGHLLNPMDVLNLVGSDNISNFKAIRKGSTDGQISCTYEN